MSNPRVFEEDPFFAADLNCDPFFSADLDNNPSFFSADFDNLGIQKLHRGEAKKAKPSRSSYRPWIPYQTASTQTCDPHDSESVPQPRAASLDLPRPIKEISSDTSDTCKPNDDVLEPAPWTMPQGPRARLSDWAKVDEDELEWLGELGHQGLDPANRPNDETPIINKIAAEKEAENRKQGMHKHYQKNPSASINPDHKTPQGSVSPRHDDGRLDASTQTDLCLLATPSECGARELTSDPRQENSRSLHDSSVASNGSTSLLNSAFRQSAIAKVRLELLSISRFDATPADEYDGSDGDAWSGSEEPEEHDDSQGARDSSANTTRASVNVGTGTTGTQTTGLPISGPGANDERSGGQGNGKKRARKEPPTSEDGLNLPRFACPYQAFEPWQGCLKRGPRNPKGGCDGINRLK